MQIDILHRCNGDLASRKGGGPGELTPGSVDKTANNVLFIWLWISLKYVRVKFWLVCSETKRNSFLKIHSKNCWDFQEW